MSARQLAEERLADALDRGDHLAALEAAAELDQLGPKPQPSTLGAALWYASNGLPVFPLRPGEKIPHRGSRGVKDATTDPAQLRSWWAANPASNIGLATGHRLDVIDFDGLTAHLSWTETFGPDWDSAEVQVLATVSTPRAGGLHVYVPTNDAGNRAGICPGVDYRGIGGYVVAPPSSTPQGSYEFLRRLDPGVLR